MATPADMPPLVTVEKLVINQTKGVLTIESAQQGIEQYNSTCRQKPIPFKELVSILMILQGFGAIEVTAFIKPQHQNSHHITWSLNAKAQP